MEKHTNKAFLHILITGIAGAVFWLIGELLLVPLFEKIWTPLAMGIYFVSFAVIVFIFFFILSVIKGDYSLSVKRKKSDTRKGLLSAVLMMVILFLITGLFEYIYELNFYTVNPPSSYLFLIDDSGSMAINDKDNERPKAISAVMNDENDKEYAVYKFTDEASLIKPMSYYQPDDIKQIEFESDGGTNIIGSLERVLNDILSNKHLGVGTYPRILLLSDGESYESGENEVLKQCTDNNISISTVGFGSCDEIVLKRIAAKTGGAYVYCDSAETLKEKIEGVISAYAKRNLLSERFVPKLDWVYAIMRILFLSLICLPWSLMKVQSLSEFSNLFWKAIRLSIGCCIVANVFLEILTKLNLPTGVIRLLFCILWTVTLGRFIKKTRFKAQLNSVDYDPDSHTPGNNLTMDSIQSGPNQETHTDRIAFGKNDGPDDENTYTAENENPFLRKPSNDFGRDNANPFSGTANGFRNFGTGSGFRSDSSFGSNNPFVGSSKKNNPFDQSDQSDN